VVLNLHKSVCENGVGFVRYRIPTLMVVTNYGSEVAFRFSHISRVRPHQ
jgi:hypothetical protein